MRILAHRGYHSGGETPNSPGALRAAPERGYGFESDIRDRLGRAVISHDTADESSPPAEEAFRALAEYRDKYTFAANVKADGLVRPIAALLREYGIDNYFLFDMSVPQMVEYAEAGLRFFTRQSEYETAPVMLDKAAGVWVDPFISEDWVTEELVSRYISAGKEVCLVSPELHGRASYEAFWRRMAWSCPDAPGLMLCTDYPDAAREVFREEGRL